jgi:hypothetical protein
MSRKQRRQDATDTKWRCPISIAHEIVSPSCRDSFKGKPEETAEKVAENVVGHVSNVPNLARFTARFPEHS